MNEKRNIACICCTSGLFKPQRHQGADALPSSIHRLPFSLAAALCLCASVVFSASSLQAEDTNSNFQSTQAAADKGDAKSQYELGNLYEKQHSYVKAAECWRKSAEQGYAPAEVSLGYAYGTARGVGRNIATAISWYRKAAEQGYPLAEYAMGGFYATGRGVTNDMAQAVQWWHKAADQNQPDAEAAIGAFYFIPTRERSTNDLNYVEALKWLRRAASHGSTAAMNDLGLAYASGMGVSIDQNESARWYLEAAERGEAQAQANIGQCYLDGRGVKYDPVQAYKWFKLSSIQGCFLGDKGLESFNGTGLLKPKQLAEAEQLALDFRPIQATNR